MDHIPDVTVRSVDGQLGVLSKDVLQQFKQPDTKEIVKGYQDIFGLSHLAKTDKKIGDKAMFDYLIGNSDRHTNNYFIRTNGDDTKTFIGFDHGFTFPTDSAAISKYGGSGNIKNHPGFNKPATPEFVQTFTNLVESGHMNQMTKFIAANIGKTESESFNQRVQTLAKKFEMNKKITVAGLI